MLPFCEALLRTTRLGKRQLAAALQLRNVVFLCFAILFAASLSASASQETPPAVAREFRATWIASVGNINFPSQPGLPAETLKQEIRSLLDTAERLRLNAVIFQVRPSCDALYSSEIEPASYYLVGENTPGLALKFDPLAYAVEQAHARGLELHAWFNPYRAGLLPRRNSSPKHVLQRHPEWIRRFGNYLWLDPGLADVQDYVTGVIMDVVRRYDIDGVHLDDYFYPYPERSPGGTAMDFPDQPTYEAYRRKGGAENRDDWRRSNVNTLVRRMKPTIQMVKPWVKFGISPFGIWRPGNPGPIKGMDAFATVYADARLWLQQGWVDYLSPQLYWGYDSPNQDFALLLRWWNNQSTAGRFVWPGLNAVKVGKVWKRTEILKQISMTRSLSRQPGAVFWNIESLRARETGLGAALAQGPYSSPALVPAFPWLAGEKPGVPKVLFTEAQAGRWLLHWTDALGNPPARWVIQSMRGGKWNTEVLPAQEVNRVYAGRQQLPEIVAITAMDRRGNLSAPFIERTRSK